MVNVMKSKDTKELLKSSRPISWINTAYPFVAAYALTVHKFDLTLLIGGLYFLIPYNLLMYGINDVFDYESDIRNPRKGGIEGAKLDRTLHKRIIYAAALTNIPFIIFFVTKSSVSALIVLLYVLFMVVAYSAPLLRFKERPLLDSITSSTHFVGPMAYGLFLGGWHPSYVPYVVSFFLWGMASHAFGSVQDINADRAGGIASIATYIGAKNTVRFSLTLYAASGIVLATQGAAASIVGLCALLYIISIAPFWNTKDSDAEIAHAGWTRFMIINWITGAVITITLIMRSL